MKAIEFPAHPDCTLCDLHEGCKNPGLPTRTLHDPSFKLPALLIVGEAPGGSEDRDGVSWVGPAGKLLSRLVLGSGFPRECDVYVSNSCRCRPPGNADPTSGRMKKCKPYLLRDLELLRERYDRVYILCAGAKAAHNLVNMSLKVAWDYQGLLFNVGDNEKTPVFFTFHPAALLPRRDPSLIRAVGPHLDYCFDSIRGKVEPPPEVAVPPRCPPMPTPFPDRVAVDIETYGLIKGKEQTVFHPRKSELIDKIPRDEIIQMVNIAWKEGDDIKGAEFLWPEDLGALRRWFRKIAKQRTTITGKNLPFDLSYLRYCDVGIRHCIHPTKVKLDDVAVLNHLDYELRPEKGLKPLATLLRVVDYRILEVRADQKDAKANSKRDRRAWQYNFVDNVAVLKLEDSLNKRILQRYGPSSAKLTDTCREHRNQLLWITLWMTEAGIEFDKKKLTTLHSDKLKRMNEIREEAKVQFDLTIDGLGSDKSIRDCVVAALDSIGILGDKRVERTSKRKDVSTGKENLNLLMAVLPIGNVHRPVIEKLQDFRTTSHLVTHYTRKLLGLPKPGKTEGNPRQGLLPGTCTAYPSWYPTPGYVSKASSGSSGGTIQGRFSAKNPAAQTMPPIIRECLTSRFRGGALVFPDQSQLEYRVAGLLSGDPYILANYAEGGDFHLRTGKFLFPHVDWEDHNNFDLYRKVGKHVNFLMLFRGGAKKLVETVRRLCGIEITEDFARECIQRYLSKHWGLNNWQEALIDEAIRTKKVELPTGWSRTFSGNKATILSTYVNEICNMPIQCIAAQLVQSAQYAIACELFRRAMRSRIPLQTHDEVVVDTAPGELVAVEGIVTKYMLRPPLMSVLEDYYGRTVPLDVGIKVIHAA